MKTDRELLELAAKAAGMYVLPDPWPDVEGWFFCWPSGGHGGMYLREIGRQSTRPAWNPLTDDGDALRLAVKLHINVEHFRSLKALAFEEVAAAPHGRGDCLAVEPTCSDAGAATRRAIVRAAAAIGEQP